MEPKEAQRYSFLPRLDGRLEARIDVARTCFWPECYRAEENP